jgi:predicted DNA-binding protein (UPF0251 family)
MKIGGQSKIVVDNTNDIDHTMLIVPERDRILTLRLNDEEHRRFKAAADDMGLTVSAMLRALVREREKKEKSGDRRQRRSK